MRPLERPYTPVAEIVVVADVVADEEVDEETDARGTNAHTTRWTIIPPNHVERESTRKTTQSLEIQTPPGTMNELTIPAVSQDISSPTASTSNIPGINATRLTEAEHSHRLLRRISKKIFRSGGMAPSEWTRSVRAVRDTPVADYSVPGVNTMRRVVYCPLIAVLLFLRIL